MDHQCKQVSNVFLLREKDPGRVYALSVLSPMPDEGEYISLDTNSVTHHLIKRAVKTDGTLGTHFVINSTRIRECRTIFAVLAELSRPEADRLPELAEFPGKQANGIVAQDLFLLLLLFHVCVFFFSHPCAEAHMRMPIPYYLPAKKQIPTRR